MVSGKTLGGGLPLAAVTGRAEIMDAVPPGGLGGTFGGNPVCCAAALAILDAVEELRPRAERSATRLRERLEAIAPAGSEVRGLGPMVALELAEQSARDRIRHRRAGARGGSRAPVVRALRQRDQDPRAVHDRATTTSSEGSTSSRDALAADVGVAGVRKTYGDVVAVDNVDLNVAAGEFFTLLGPSGSGKTTTLRMIAGFEQPDTGTITLGGEDITRRPPYSRDVNTVFQDYALFPHMTVAENVGYGLKVKRVPRRERAAKVAEVLRMVRLEAYGGRKPVQLSGGQRQRVALARSIVNEPKVLLLDEPLGALDLKLRQEMQVFLKGLQQDLAMTFLYVTHDQEEALTMSDHIAVFNDGRIEQVGSPGRGLRASRDGVRRRLRRHVEHRRARRPAAVASVRSGSRSTATAIPATIEDVVFVGAFKRLVVRTDAGEQLTVVRPNDGSSIAPGTRVHVSWDDADAYEIQPPEPPAEQEVR